MKKRCLAMLLTLCFGLVLCYDALAVESFKDINGHWAQVQIEKWVADGLIAGYPDGQFQPNEPITRAEFVSLVNRVYRIQQRDTLYSFTDVKASDWFYSQVMSGKEAGYIAGYPDGTFKPNHTLSRQEAAALLTKLLRLSPGDQTVLTSYPDYLSMAHWAQESIQAVITYGLMSGFPDKTFRAQQNITRAEAVVTLERALTYSRDSLEGIKGIVKLDDKPVPGATVKIYAVDSQEALKATVSDEQGVRDKRCSIPVTIFIKMYGKYLFPINTLPVIQIWDRYVLLFPAQHLQAAGVEIRTMKNLPILSNR